MEGYIYCGMCILSFVIGAMVGQRAQKGKDITINPVKAIKEEIKDSKEKKQEDLKIRQFNAMLKNIDNYDGSGMGQTEIPKE